MFNLLDDWENLFYKMCQFYNISIKDEEGNFKCLLEIFRELNEKITIESKSVYPTAYMEDILKTLSDKDIVGLDVVETASNKLGDSTAVVAAKIIYDFLTLVK